MLQEGAALLFWTGLASASDRSITPLFKRGGSFAILGRHNVLANIMSESLTEKKIHKKNPPGISGGLFYVKNQGLKGCRAALGGLLGRLGV